MIPVRTSCRVALAAVVFLCTLTSVVRAQGMPGARNPQRQELERRVRARYGEMMRQRLGLSAEQSDRLGQTVDSFADRRQRLLADEQALRRRIEAILLEQDPTDEEASSLLARMQDLRVEEADLFRAEQEALQQVLTPVQLVRFHAMREQLGKRIMQLRGGQGPPGPGRRPGGGFPGGAAGDPWGWELPGP